ETADGLRGGLECSADLFDAATAARMVGHFQELLASAVARPDERVAELSLLTLAERRAPPPVGTRTCPRAERLPAGVARPAALRPDQIALSCGDRALTYAELDRRTNRLARALRARGVGPDVPVGLYLERSIELVVGVLGILKAGGAYVPIDPVYPADRR